MGDVRLVYRALFASRRVDEQERAFVAQNRAHFHVSAAGHEASAALAPHLTNADWLHLHYRDKALMLARGVPAGEFFLSSLAKGASHSAGRQMSAHLCAREHNILSVVGPVGNNALQAVGIAAAVKNRDGKPIVVCSIGDGTTQQGEFLEATLEAVRSRLPVLFLIHDNRYSISTHTRGKTFFDLPTGPAKEFLGLRIHRFDGTQAIRCIEEFARVVRSIRESRGPAIVVLEVERLADHTNADDESTYRPAEEIDRAHQTCDPLPIARDTLLKMGTSEAELLGLERDVDREVSIAAQTALLATDPVPEQSAKASYPVEVMIPQRLWPSIQECVDRDRTMRAAIHRVLAERLATDPRVFLYGQDIEDPKGGVFGVEKGLSHAFPGRVVNAPLSESTIVGSCIGRALAGERPVAIIQFADFLPLAFNQIFSELGTMYWRTKGQWQCPVIVMAACGAYRPGLGTFHAQTLDGVMSHTPGVDVFMPSTAIDAAELLDAAFGSPRPTIFLFPKARLNRVGQSAETTGPRLPPGRARRVVMGNDLTLVAWGSTVELCRQAASYLGQAGHTIDFYDLRTLSPWDADGVVASVERTGRLVVVHEDNITGGFGAEVVSTVVERCSRQVVARRVARSDCGIPYHFPSQQATLPSLRGILETCGELLNCDVEWSEQSSLPHGHVAITAIGSGPADETVEVVALRIAVGDEIRVGQTVAELDASKSVVDLASTVAGKVVEVLAKPGERIDVGRPLVIVSSRDSPSASVAESNPPIIRIRPKSSLPIAASPRTVSDPKEEMLSPSFAYLSRPTSATGSRLVPTSEIARGIAGWTAEDAIARTGVATRPWVVDGETPVTLAMQAANRLIDQWSEENPPLSAILCSTTSPQESTPSIACRVATQLARRIPIPANCFAVDINAACSGFLYALRWAFDHLMGDPNGSVLLLTSEVLSTTVDAKDPTTGFLFGDAATAALVSALPQSRRSLRLLRPELGSAADHENALWGPCFGNGFLRMDGIAVARTAYKAMASQIQALAKRHGVRVEDLAALLPHPGSKRILQNVADHLNFPPERVWHTLGDTGNTSSSSIPLALERYWDHFPLERQIALVAFGAGFTTAAAIGQFTKENHP